MSLQKTQIDFDWAYCQLLCLEHDAITEMLDELYPEVSENEEFIHEFNVASTHWQLIELKSFAAEIESQMKDFPSGTSTTEKITSLADFFTEYEQYQVESLNSLIENGDVEILEGHAEISFFYQLLPLFFSFDLKTKSGALIKSVKTREIVFKAYQKALKESGKNLSGVKTSYKEEAEQSEKVIFMAPFDKDFALAEKRFNAGKNQYLTPEDIEDLDLEKEEELAQVDIEILKQSIIDRQVFKPGTIVETTSELAASLVDIGKARYVEADEDEPGYIENTQDSGFLMGQVSGSDGSKRDGEKLAPELDDTFVPLEMRTRPGYNVQPPEQVVFWKYIQAWIIAGLLSGVISRVVDNAIAAMTLNASNFETSPYWVIQPIFSALVWLGILIFVYSLHKSLKIRKVLPWVWGLGTLGVLSGLGMTLKTFQTIGMDLPTIFVVTTLLSFILAAFSFGKYFESFYPERY